MADMDLSLMPAPITARFSLRGDAAMARLVGEARLAGKAPGMALPLKSLTTVEAAQCSALWLGPDEWLVLSQSRDIAATLGAEIGNHPHSLVDISERQIGLELSGRLAALVLSSGCPVDLDETAFPVGMAMRTLFHKAEIVLWRRGSERFHLEIWRSFAPYVEGHIIEARRGCWGL